MQYSNIFARLINATQYSLSGLYFAIKNEQPFRYECVVFILICLLLSFMSLPIEWNVLLISAWLLVICLELINSSMEKAFDLIDKTRRPEIKAGKDMISASVFVAICMNIFLWFATIMK